MRADTGRRVRSAVALALAVAAVGLVASMGAGAILASGENGAARDQMTRRSALVAGEVSAECQRYIDALRIVAAAAGSFEQLTSARFAKATQPLGDMRLAGATSVAFLISAPDEQVPTAQAFWRANGAPDLVLNPHPGGRDHIFSVFVQPLDGLASPTPGIDVTQSVAPTLALTEARRTGHVAVSRAYQLIRDHDLPPEQRQMSFVLAAPVYSPGAVFRGWVLMGLRGRDFFGATLQRAAQDLVDVSLFAQNADGASIEVAALRASVHGRRDLSRDIRVPVADDTWRLHVAANGSRLPGGDTGLPRAITLSGTVLGLLLAGLVYVLATARGRAEIRVRTATAELRAAEARARQDADLLAAIMDGIGDGVGVVDERGEFLLHNPAAKRILGITDDLGDPDRWQDHYGMFRPDGATPFPKADMPLVRALSGESTDGVQLVIRNRQRPDGVHITVSARPLPLGNGQCGAVAVFHDITARIEHERALAANADRLATELALRETTEAELRAARDALAAREAHLADVIEAVDVAIVLCDADGRITRANRTANEIGGTVPEAVPVREAAGRVNATVHDASGAEATDDTPLLAALRGEEVRDWEITIAPPGRPARTLLAHARPLRAADGSITGAVSAYADITTVREQQADLAAFAGVVAHDLKAPLTAIAGYTDLIDEALAEGAEPAALRPRLARVTAGVTRMRTLIDDLLAYATARDRMLQTMDVDLRSVADQVVTTQLEEAASTAGTAPDVYIGALPWVHGDPGMLRQLLDNLIGNAIKYTPPGQTARVDVTADADDEGWVCLEVADRGVGIPSGQHQAIFATFHRAHPHAGLPGTGLGLAICQRIVQRHGGTITAADNPGGGTLIRLTLPAATRDTRAGAERGRIGQTRDGLRRG